MGKSIEQRLNDHLAEHDFDIRKSEKVGFSDQKCTHDLLCAVADAILEYTDENKSKSFTVRDVWVTPRANEIIVGIFQKPTVTDPKAKNEYNKVFSQQIKLLEYANILEATGKLGTAIVYTIRKKKLLTYIAQKPQNTLNFLTLYLEKLLQDSELLDYFSAFFMKPGNTSYTILKHSFLAYIQEHTNKQEKRNIYRIFAKILNPLAFKRNSQGTKGGKVSPQPIQYAELFYNRTNFRDILKPKKLTRQQFLADYEHPTPFENYQTEKTKRQIKKRHGTYSEVHRFKVVTSIQVHHIFMKNEFPELSDKFENLITLTPTQHNSFAHPNNNTSQISLPYQLVCLLAKLESVEQSIQNGDGFYSLEDFKSVVNTGLDEDILTGGMSSEEIKHALSIKYLPD